MGITVFQNIIFFLSFGVMQLPLCSAISLPPNLNITCISSPQQGHWIPLVQIKLSRRQGLMLGTWIPHNKGPMAVVYLYRELLAPLSFIQQKITCDYPQCACTPDSTRTLTHSNSDMLGVGQADSMPCNTSLNMSACLNSLRDVPPFYLGRMS